jgi:hypothetical protein
MWKGREVKTLEKRGEELYRLLAASERSDRICPCDTKYESDRHPLKIFSNIEIYDRSKRSSKAGAGRGREREWWDITKFHKAHMS